MKKKRIVIAISMSILVVISGVGFYILGINPFINWGSRIEADYNNQFEVFENIAFDANEGFVYMKQDDFDISNADYNMLFKELGYLFISGDSNEMFFCKTIDGMNAIGLLFTNSSDWIPPSKGKIMKVLDDENHWYLYSENYL